jgi:hypothetical protein
VIQNAPSPTLDGLFRRILGRQPNALALVDPADKQRVTAQPQKRLTYAEADQAISALAAHFIETGLPANSVIAIQLPNTVEFVLTVLAAHRAGLVVALLPQLWRQAELTVALNRTGARAIVTTSRIDGVSHADLAMNAAAEAFSIRHVCGFGNDLPEGMASLDTVMAGAPAASSIPQDARRAAIVSFDVSSDGLRAVARTHLSVIAGGLVTFLESGMPQGATILSALGPSSFASLASTLVPWLLSGGTLVLHHPFDGDVFERQVNEQACNVLVAPAPLALRFAESGTLAQMPTLRNIVGLWRAPEQVASSEPWPSGQSRLTDIYLFGEAGLFGARRGDDEGAPAQILPGPYGAPRAVANSAVAGEILLTPKGTLGLRGPMVPVAAYAPAVPASNLLAAQPPMDYVDTGYAARQDRSTGAILITAPPFGIMAVGGYRFLAQDLQEWAKRLGQGAMLTALPDRLCGHRLAGRANNNARAREALAELGLNPLMVEAFRDRATSG